MNQNPRNHVCRRRFLKDTGRIAAASALAAGILPRIYAAEDNTIKLALVGCGGLPQKRPP